MGASCGRERPAAPPCVMGTWGDSRVVAGIRFGCVREGRGGVERTGL